MLTQFPPLPCSAQGGNATLFAVLVIMALATSLLGLTRHSLEYGAQQVNAEKNYLRAFYQAQSALAWGRTYSWSTREGWQCPLSPSTSFSVCLWRSHAAEGWLRGSSEKSERLLWQRVTFSAHLPTQAQRHPRGWTDDCPLSVTLCRQCLPGR